MLSAGPAAIRTDSPHLADDQQPRSGRFWLGFL